MADEWMNGMVMDGWMFHLLCCYMRGAGVVPETCLASRTSNQTTCSLGQDESDGGDDSECFSGDRTEAI